MAEDPLSDATVHSVWIWRQDSQTLFRIRPVLEEFLYLAGRQQCDHQELGAEKSCREEDYALGDMCFACRYKILADQLNAL